MASIPGYTIVPRNTVQYTMMQVATITVNTSSVNIRRWTYVCYCRSVMTQKLILTGQETFRRAERQEAALQQVEWLYNHKQSHAQTKIYPILI